MIINYYGLSCFKFTVKSLDSKEHVLVVDPFEAKGAGLKLPRLKADVVLTSKPSDPLHNNLASVYPVSDKDVFLVNAPGEYEVQDMFIQGVKSREESILYYLELEKIKIVFLGSLSSPTLTPEQMEILENSDILILPIGGTSTLNSKQAKELTNQLEPRAVMPCFYKAPGVKAKLIDTPEQFFKELGVKPADKQDKLKISIKDVPQEELKAFWLTF
jgi:L-ascorbate metabolism protein UlaG (beta-lactamase superfamily)